MRLAFFLLIISVAIHGKSLQGKSFFTQHGRGWHWYELQLIMGQKKILKQDKQKFLSSSALSPTEQVTQYRKTLEAKLALAWLNPTPQNIKTYIEMQKDLTDRSKLFSEVWLQTVFTNPALDHTLISPVNQKARHIQIDQQKLKTKQIIHDLAKEYGLFFFFKGGCAYCHQFAPIVKEFAQIYGWEVLAISEDGGKLREFPNSVKDNGLMNQWNVEVLPALFAICPQNSEVIPIAYGLTSIEEMEKRIVKLAGKK